jgi:hypothetical protein
MDQKTQQQQQDDQNEQIRKQSGSKKVEFGNDLETDCCK